MSAVIEKYKTDVIRFVRCKVSNSEDAQDIVAETWKVALEEIWDFEYRGVPIKNWLFEMGAALLERREMRQK